MEGRGEKGRGVKMLHTYRHTDIQTYRASDAAGPRGAFAPRKKPGHFKTKPDHSTKKPGHLKKR